MGQHFHAQRMGQFANSPANTPKADESNTLADQLESGASQKAKLPAALPLALSYQLVVPLGANHQASSSATTCCATLSVPYSGTLETVTPCRRATTGHRPRRSRSPARR